MKYINKTSALMQIQMVQMVMVQHGYHTMVSTPSECGTPEFELSVFFENDEELHTQNILLLNLMRIDDEIKIEYHNDPTLKGGWIDYKVEF